MLLKETTKFVTGALQGARLLSQHTSLASAKKSLAKARRKDPRAEVFATDQWLDGLKRSVAGEKVEKPVVEVPKPKAAEKVCDGLFDAGKFFRAGSCKLDLGTLLADGRKHEVLELQAICHEHGLKTHQVINFAAMRLRSAGFTVTRGGGTIQVSA